MSNKFKSIISEKIMQTKDFNETIVNNFCEKLLFCWLIMKRAVHRIFVGDKMEWSATINYLYCSMYHDITELQRIIH